MTNAPSSPFSPVSSFSSDAPSSFSSSNESDLDIDIMVNTMDMNLLDEHLCWILPGLGVVVSACPYSYSCMKDVVLLFCVRLRHPLPCRLV